jgi:hypothetical protein
MLSLVSSLAVLSTAQAVAPALADETSSLWHIGDSIATIRMCDALGYTIDRQGLANWAMARRSAVTTDNQASTGTEAQSEIEQAANDHTARIYAVYWDDAMQVGARTDGAIDKQRRFVKIYRKKCDTLAGSPELGAFVTPPLDHRAPSQVIASITQKFERARLEP